MAEIAIQGVNSDVSAILAGKAKKMGIPKSQYLVGELKRRLADMNAAPLPEPQKKQTMRVWMQLDKTLVRQLYNIAVHQSIHVSALITPALIDIASGYENTVKHPGKGKYFKINSMPPELHQKVKAIAAARGVSAASVYKKLFYDIAQDHAPKTYGK